MKHPARAEVVVVVDPAGMLTTSVEGAFATAGFAVRRAPSGLDALEHLRAGSVVCVVVDRDQLGPEVIPTLRGIRGSHEAIPMVVASSNAATDLVVEVIKADAFDFVVMRDGWIPALVEKVRTAAATVRPVAEYPASWSGFVGREPELRALDTELARTMDGQGRVVLVTGDEGIGKTLLAREVMIRARARGWRSLRGACPEVGDAPAYWPWIQILRAYGKTVSSTVLAEDLGESAAETAWIAPALRAHMPGGPLEATGLTRFQLADGITQLLRRGAARQPLLVVIDDLHRADADAAHLFGFVAAECVDAPLLLLGTYRDDVALPSVAAELNRVASLSAATILRLDRFDVDVVRRYVEQTTNVRPSARVVEAIHAKTGGHPLFVAEITQLLAAEGHLSEREGSGTLRLVLPATRRQVIAARLDRLSPASRAVLDVAAVIGPEFNSEILAAVMHVNAVIIRERLIEAIDEHIVFPSDEEPDLYRFTHVLVRDVLYDALAVEARRRMHVDIADALERHALERWTRFAGEPPLAAIAHHLREGASSRNGHRRALRAVVAAGERAMMIAAYEDAGRHFEMAVELAERHRLTVPSVQQLLVRLADAYRSAGDVRRAHQVGRRALAIAYADGEPLDVATAVLAFAGGLPRFGVLGSLPEVADELERALLLLPTHAVGLRAHLMARLAEERIHGVGPSVPSLARQAIELGRSTGDPHVLADVLRSLHSALWTPEDVEWRAAIGAEILALGDRLGDRMLSMNGRLLLLWSALEHGDIDVAWEQLGVCQRLAAKLRLPRLDWVNAAAHVCLTIARGRLDNAEALIDAAFATAGRNPSPSMQLVLGAQREHVRFLRGETADLDEWYHFILQNLPSAAPILECAVVHHDVRLGHLSRARTRLTALVADDFARLRRNGSWLASVVFLADAAVLLGEREAACRIRAALAPFAAHHAILAPCYMLAPVAHYLAALDGFLDDAVSARRHHEQALALAERAGVPHWVAHVRLAYGRFLATSQDAVDRTRGSELSASGRALAESVGARSLLRETDALHSAAGEPAVDRIRFRLLVDEWEIEFRGAHAKVPSRAGMAYLRCLLERPGVPVSAIELASLGRGRVLVDGGGGPVIDRRAVADVRSRLSEIEVEIAGYARENIAASPDLMQERRECVRYLSRRGTEMLGAADRARSGVTKAIGRAIEAIAQAHPALGHHLSRHVETGRLCRYLTDPGTPIVFEF